MDENIPLPETLALTVQGCILAGDLLAARIDTMPEARWLEISFNGRLEPVRDPTSREVLAVLLAWANAQNEHWTQSRADVVYDNVLIALTLPEESK